MARACQCESEPVRFVAWGRRPLARPAEHPPPAAVDSWLLQLASRMPAIKPIDTKAYGRRFRSRLEARWAVFFSTLGLKWEYEPEGFDVDGCLYLPDFRVWTPQGQPIWYEIKPSNCDQDEKFKRFEQALLRDDRVIRSKLLPGDPLSLWESHHVCPRCGLWIERRGLDTLCSRLEVAVSCFACDFETPCGGDNPAESDGVNGCVWYPNKGWIHTENSQWEKHDALVRRAVEAAMSARFEHGVSIDF